MLTSNKLQSAQESSAIINRFSDFWLLGGASIVIMFMFGIGSIFRGYMPVEQHLVQIAAMFGMLTLVCNHPHFMISYKFGYGRGFKFIFTHWFNLLVVPLGLLALYGFAFFHYEDSPSDYFLVRLFNLFFSKAGLSFHFGEQANLGTELLGLSVWIMYITVGWHYAKQVFGCMMVYAHYDQYPLTLFQRTLIKLSGLSVAFFQFAFLYIFLRKGHEIEPAGFFMDIPFTHLGLPEWFYKLASSLLILFDCLMIFFVFIGNYLKNRRWPSLNFLVPWIAFHVWWIPIFMPLEVYMIVPFFHSLQYLPFAYRIERSKQKPSKYLALSITLKIFVLLVIGFLMFELIPYSMDQSLNKNLMISPNFFLISFVVFINVHHFFIDNCVWRFNQKEVRDGILVDPEPLSNPT